MRLLLVNQFYIPDLSPTAQLAASLAKHRASRGDEVTVIASRSTYLTESSSPPTEPSSPVKVLRLWTPDFGKSTILRRCVDYAAFYLGAIARLATLPEQDVIISLTTPPYIAWAAVLHKALHPQTKLVFWNMDCYPEAAERLGKLKPGGAVAKTMRWLNSQLFRRLDHVVCLDGAMQNLVMRQYGPRHRRLPASVIPNWEPRDSFSPSDVPGEWVGVARYALRERFVILYLGNMGEGHEFATVLEAAQRLDNAPVAFLFVGGGRRKPEIRDEASRRGLRNVIVHDYVPLGELRSVMACAGCALITLRDDCLGVMSPSKLHASLAMCLPILYVGPEGSNVDEAVRRFSCGVSLRQGDVEGLVAFVRNALDGSAGFLEYRDAARNAFEAEYCDSRALPRFDALLEGLTEARLQTPKRAQWPIENASP